MLLITFFVCIMLLLDGDPPLPHRKKLIGVGMAMLLVAAMLPSKSTIYAIIASEYGDKMLHTQTAGKAEKALDAWLDKQSGDNK